MIGIDQSIGVAILAGITGGAVASTICALTSSGLIRYLGRFKPAFRCVLLLALLLLPLVTSIAFIAILLSPVLEYGPVAYHCHTHQISGCMPHALQTFDETLSLGILLVAASLILWPIARFIKPLRHLQLAHRGLRVATEVGALSQVRLIHDDRPLAFSLGLFRPTIFISTGLQNNLDRAELDAVIQHERAHILRRDAVWQLIAEVLSIGHTRQTARLFLRDLHLASEQACDDYASRCLGERLTVASAILKVERLCAEHPPTLPVGAHGVTGSSVPARVQILLHPPEQSDLLAVASVPVATICFITAVFLTAEPLHHLIESLF